VFSHRRLTGPLRLACLLILACAAARAADPVLRPPGAIIDEATFSRWQAARAAAQPQWRSGAYLNALILESSAYLLQHSANPVNWIAWSDAALAQAAAGKKPILLSIGYSTCHWCHVMNRESFSDPDIARVINEHFVAVKVDREEMPALDQYYSNLLAMIRGEAGWPLTAILDSTGAPVFLESYLEPQALRALLMRVARMVREQPDYLGKSAEFLAAASGSVPPAAPDQGPLSLAELAETAKAVLARMDPQHGGILADQKFPNESVLLFLSAMQRRQPAQELQAAIDLQLQRMVKGGVYDHVNGGFFRYATDRSWTVPHYEKMLYNQALLLRAYTRAYRASGHTLYRWAAVDTVDFIERWLRDGDAGYFSAVSADTAGEEGCYYLFSDRELDTLSPEDANAAGLARYQGPGGPDRHGIQLSHPASKAAGGVRQHLRELRGDTERPFVDRKIVTAWNGVLLSSLLSAQRVSGTGQESPALSHAAEHADWLWSRLYSTEEDMLYRIWYEDKREVPGTLEDYAYLLQAFIDLYDATTDSIWLNRSRQLANSLLQQFLNQGRFTYTDRRTVGPHTQEPLSIVDGEMPAADAVALGALWQLSVRLGDQRLQRDIVPVLQMLRGKFRSSPLANLHAGSVLADIDLGPVTLHQYFARGNGRVSIFAPDAIDKRADACPLLRLAFELAPGWHINSATPLQDYLRPTRVSLYRGEESVSIRGVFPEPEITRLGFQPEPLSVYTGSFEIEINRRSSQACEDQASGQKLSVQLQACTDRICLAPETLHFMLPMVMPGRP